MTETPALDLVTDRKVVKATRWTTLQPHAVGKGGHWVNDSFYRGSYGIHASQ